MSKKSVAINTIQEFEEFIKQAKSGTHQEVESLKISNSTIISQDQIQELSTLLPNLKELDYKKDTLNIYGSFINEDEDDEDEDEHGACGCCRTDRYE